MADAPRLPWDPADLAALARERLTQGAATYFETTAVFPPAHDNEDAWAAWRFVPRVGRDVSAVSTATRLLGEPLAAPVLLAPCAFAGHAHPEGELAVARAAADTGAVFVVSAASTHTPADVARATGARCWLQVYVPADPGALDALLADAAAAGFGALVVTLDAAVASMRVHGYVPDRVVDPAARARPHASPLNPAVTWDSVAELARSTQLPVLVKGVLHPDDARAAIDHGAAGVVVSNHGGRQLDGVVATADVLEGIAAACGGDAAVVVDGGIRTGRDVLRALCLGADAVMVGRPYLWALAIAGRDGVIELLDRLRLELENALALTGCRGVADTGRALLARAGCRAVLTAPS